MIPLSSRRTLLKGLPASLVGLALASPFWDRLIRRAYAGTTPGQQRLLVWHVPDGLPPEWFFPATAGALTIRSDRTNDLTGTTFNTAIPAADLPTFLLQPIASYAANTTIVNGISNPGSSDHVLSTQSCLTGDAVTATSKGTSVSLDVLMSEVNQTKNHPIPVLRTGLYGSSISYTGTRDLCRPRNNNNKWIEPSWQPVTDARIMLDAIGASLPAAPTTADAGSSAASLKTASRLAKLGAVKARVAAMRCAAGTPAATRLEAYIAQVDILETTETQMRTVSPFKTTISGTDAAVTAAQSKADWTGFDVTSKYLLELVVTAFALDYCPAVTLQWAASGRNHISGSKLTDTRYSFMPLLEVAGAGEHALAHPENSAFIAAGYTITGAQSTRDRVRIRRWFFDQMKTLLDRLSSIPDGSGTLFDHTVLLHTSEFGGPNSNSAGGQHSNRNLPYMTVAGSQTPIKGGQSLQVSRNHGDYLLTLAQGFGSKATTMGIGTSAIPGILK